MVISVEGRDDVVPRRLRLRSAPLHDVTISQTPQRTPLRPPRTHLSEELGRLPIASRQLRGPLPGET
jgi:hypothetical protein